ncbi:MAG TPA: PLP-dependent transferase, partial [Candidimonas sp.]|nr:PLP-dependent transferase [Candidimonas sp.]
MDRACANALALAKYLSQHPKVAKIHYPGLHDHPQHDRAAQLFGSRFGALMGVELIDEVDLFDFLNRLQVLILATHLGDNRSLVLPMAHTIYYEMGAERRALMGISDNFLRVSIGIEDVQDLIGDFDQALQ